MDKRLSVLIREIKKSSRPSGSSILSLINLDKNKSKSTPKETKKSSTIISIDDVRKNSLDIEKRESLKKEKDN